ncbi:MAG: SRPBCC family protein [Reyranella sp.]|uniref:SRPBCC family protein n=1 Tax=Reyranella sp. TaxID=1929291 RepID=UPI0027318BA1|nr:SRPBCC family protein [Reyranella sp.]MDP1961414.1 SRPBCC family protein [Reyranella sp.]MDP2376474.1 SRPBCC family protein [Reyranella sp.]
MTDAAYGRITAPAEVRFERLLPGPIETVWQFLVDSDKRGQWLASGPMELKEGGAVELRFQHRDLSPHKVAPPERYKEMDEKGHVARERVLRVEPPRLLAISWGKSEVTFELVPEGKNVRLILTHRHLPDRADMVQTSGGWHTHLDILIERANGRVPGAFWTVFGDIEGEYEKRYPR